MGHPLRPAPRRRLGREARRGPRHHHPSPGQPELSRACQRRCAGGHVSHETQQSLERDGFRALLSVDAGQVVLRSRRGTETRPAFPETMAGVVQPPQATAFDGELVVWEQGRLAFERLQNRLQRRGAGAARAAAEAPAHFVAFDLLRLSGTDTTVWPYRRRRAALESVFASRRPSAPWALCPSTADPNMVRGRHGGSRGQGPDTVVSARPPRLEQGTRPHLQRGGHRGRDGPRLLAVHAAARPL
ncbi:hypothetical protein ACIPM2_35990 [Streptomyces sp. NPDC086081]|uniref:ATP-dependent DNA ligase n=1 Tax=Streptomyces sp. NPDC086081 TaxID=3365749 RepID=UPI00380DB184